MYQLDEIKLLEAHESEVLCLEYSSVDNGRFSPSYCIYLFNPQCINRNKSRLLFSSAEMFKKPLWQTVWTQIRLLL